MSYEVLTGMGGVTVERDVSATMRDGTVLLADVYRPKEEGPHPVLLSRHPYDKQAALSNFGYAHPAWYAQRGYLVVVQDCRGRYLSDGHFTPFLNESEDGYDTVEWAARLPLGGHDRGQQRGPWSRNGSTQSDQRRAGGCEGGC